MRIIVCGSRSFSNYDFLREKVIEEINKWLNGDSSKISEIEIITGGALGADYMAGTVAKEYGLKLTVFPAQWDEFGKRAGYVRNAAMIDYAIDDDKHECLVIAFWDGKSTGTLDMIQQSDLLEVPIKIIKTVGLS